MTYFPHTPAAQPGTTYTQGTGVSISPSNEISIGQEVSTTNTVTFKSLELAKDYNGFPILPPIINFIDSQNGGALAFIHMESDGSSGGRLQFSTRDGSLSNERLRINRYGAIGIGGANYGTAGQVLISNGSGSAVSWVNPVTTTYTQGTGVSISPSNQISIGQSVGTGDSPSFNGVYANGIALTGNLSCSSITLNGTLTCAVNLNPSTDAGIGSTKRLGSSPYNRWGEIYCYYLYYVVGGQASDDRIKHNEKKITNGLDVIAQLVPKKYQKSMKMYDADYNGEIEGQWDWESGLIAQELLNTDLSWCVRGGDRIDETTGEKVEDLYSVDYNSIFAYNISATQELHQLVQSQQQLIANLEARLVALESS